MRLRLWRDACNHARSYSHPFGWYYRESDRFSLRTYLDAWAACGLLSRRTRSAPLVDGAMQSAEGALSGVVRYVMWCGRPSRVVVW